MAENRCRPRAPVHCGAAWFVLTLVAVILSPFQSAAQAANLGYLHVHSKLGQPLQADVDLTDVTAEEARHLAVKVAMPDAYMRTGLLHAAAVPSLHASLKQSTTDRYVVQVRSTQPMTEPFVDILLEVSWDTGRTSSTYAILLNPVGENATAQTFMPMPVIQATTPDDAKPARAPLAAGLPDPIARATAPTLHKPTGQAPQQHEASPTDRSTVKDANGQDGKYTVQRGDSLSSIAIVAGQHQETASLDQMLVALYRNNPSAFVRGNINRLRVGSVLKMPSQPEVLKVPPRQAHQEIVAYTAGFAGYRNRLAAAAEAHATSFTGADSSHQRSGRVSARDESRSASAKNEQNELHLSKAGRAAGEAATRKERLIATERSLMEMGERASLLQRNISDLERLLALKDAELAKLAAASANSPPEGKGAATTSTMATVAKAASSPQTYGASQATPGLATTGSPVRPKVVDVMPQAGTAIVPPPPKEESIFARMTGGPTTLLLGGALIALLSGWMLYHRWNQRRLLVAYFESCDMTPDTLTKLIDHDTGKPPLTERKQSSDRPGQGNQRWGRWRKPRTEDGAPA